RRTKNRFWLLKSRHWNSCRLLKLRPPRLTLLWMHQQQAMRLLLKRPSRTHRQRKKFRLLTLLLKRASLLQTQKLQLPNLLPSRRLASVLIHAENQRLQLLLPSRRLLLPNRVVRKTLTKRMRTRTKKQASARRLYRRKKASNRASTSLCWKTAILTKVVVAVVAVHARNRV